MNDKNNNGGNNMKSYRIDNVWGKVIVTGFINGTDGRIVAEVTGNGWKENERIAAEKAEAWLRE